MKSIYINRLFCNVYIKGNIERDRLYYKYLRKDIYVQIGIILYT